MQAKVKHFVDKEGTVILPHTTQEAIYTRQLNLYVNCNSIVDFEDGSETAPFKTIQKAIDNMTFINEIAYIRIASGTYDEDVVIGNKNGNAIAINGYVTLTKATADAVVNVKSITVVNASNMSFSGINFYGETEGKSLYLNCGRYAIHDCNFTSPMIGNHTAIFGYNANIMIYNTTFTNYDSAFTAGNGAVIMPNKDSVTYTGCTRKYDNIGGMASDGKSFDDYLLLAGGTMTGALTTPKVSMTGDNIIRNTNKNQLSVMGGSDFNSGASLRLFGAESTGEGSFNLIAKSSETVYKSLEGNTSGLLTWGGKKIVLDGDFLSDTAHPLSHNGFYRGKNLGTITASNVDAFVSEHGIATGQFTDLYVGDYFTIQDGTYNKEWEIAGFDTYLHKGDREFTQHHLALIPKTNLLQSYMNSTNVTTGGYVGSYMHTTVIPAVNTNLAKALGNHLLTRRALLTKTVNTSIASGAGAGWTGASTDWDWYDVKACLMSEVAVYGSRVLSSSFYDVGEDCERLPIFHFKGHSYTRQWFWLRAVTSSATFAIASYYGHASHSDASTSDGGVRPLICFG